jgi:multidrug efflux pump subunit AcrA (membrane-fusion protein)
MKRPTAAAIVLAAFAMGVLATYFWLRAPSPPATAEEAAPGKERKVLYWHDPMVPGPRFDKPGKSPFMDMELVPVYEDEASAQAGAPIVTVRPEIVNNLGVRTHEVRRAPLARRTVSHGYLFRGETDGGYYAQVDIFDRDADWVRAGLPARLSFDALPGETFAGRVAQIDPDTGIGARTVKAQVRVQAPDARLKPNMFAEVAIESPASAQLAVPREALIRTGSRTVVVLALDAGRFQPVEVVPGAEAGEMIEIRSGLKEGERVVVSGQFLIDSEANVRASFARMQPAEGGAPAPTAPAAPATDHSQHQH